MVEAAGDWVGIASSFTLLTTCVLFAQRWLKRRRWVSFFGLRNEANIDVVLTTSDISTSHVGVAAQRPTTGLGQVRGLAVVAKALGRYLNKRPFEVFMSGRVFTTLNDHVILLGGPAKNAVVKKMLESGCWLTQEAGEQFHVDDIEGSFRIPGYSFSTSGIRLDEGGVPDRDIAIVLCGPSPFSHGSERRTVVCCFGMTSYGTEAAAVLAFSRLPDMKRAQWRRAGLHQMGGPDSVSVLAAEVSLAHGTVGRFGPIHAASLACVGASDSPGVSTRD